MPPPVQWGAVREPWRARPVPFCFQGLAPPPRTSARVLVDCVPLRRAASWAVTTWCMTAMLGSTPNMASSSSTVPAFVPVAVFVSRVAMSATCLDRVADDHEATLRAGDSTPDEDEVALGVGRHDREVQRRDLLAAHAAGHLGAAEHAGRRGAGADGAGRAVDAVGAVGGGEAAEAVALHHTGEALALADGGDVDLV